MVPSGFDTACLLAGSPTSNCPSFVKATYDGNALPPTLVPSAEGIMVGLPPIITAAAELLVLKSIPIILLISHGSPQSFFVLSRILNAKLVTNYWRVSGFK